jgi:hypothetical protein
MENNGQDAVGCFYAAISIIGILILITNLMTS